MAMLPQHFFGTVSGPLWKSPHRSCPRESRCLSVRVCGRECKTHELARPLFYVLRERAVVHDEEGLPPVKNSGALLQHVFNLTLIGGIWLQGEELGIVLGEASVYTIDTVKMLTELQFEKMGVAIDQVASLQAVLGSGSSKEHGPYKVTRISIGDKCYLDKIAEPSKDDPEVEEVRHIFPEADIDQTNLILHSPSDVWGHDGNRLVVGVVASCHMQPDVMYTWYKDKEIFKKGNFLCSTPIDEAGTYSVEVQCGDKTYVAEPFTVNVIKPATMASSSVTQPDDVTGHDYRLRSSDVSLGEIFDPEETADIQAKNFL
ncbi:hypothetical protein QZH41_000884, partial [Actinostola sp. cb2023]